MNCSNHPEIISVMACGRCGAGMCLECRKASELTYENKPVCRDCNYNEINNEISIFNKKKVWSIVKFALGAICLLVAYSIYKGGAGIENVIIIAAFGALPTAWKIMFHSTPEERWSNAVDDKIADLDGIGGGLINWLIRGIFKFIFAILIAAIAAPILVIVNFIKVFVYSARVKKYQTLLANFAI